MRESKPIFAAEVPGWQVAVVIVGFPLLYATNGFLPWSVGLFADHDRSWYVPYFGSLALLHWLSVAWVFFVLRRADGEAKEIGLGLSSGKFAMIFGIPVAVAVMIIVCRENWPASEAPASRQVILPTAQGGVHRLGLDESHRRVLRRGRLSWICHPAAPRAGLPHLAGGPRCDIGLHLRPRLVRVFPVSGVLLRRLAVRWIVPVAG